MSIIETNCRLLLSTVISNAENNTYFNQLINISAESQLIFAHCSTVYKILALNLCVILYYQVCWLSSYRSPNLLKMNPSSLIFDFLHKDLNFHLTRFLILSLTPLYLTGPYLNKGRYHLIQVALSCASFIFILKALPHIKNQYHRGLTIFNGIFTVLSIVPINDWSNHRKLLEYISSEQMLQH
ncbi:MAG: hypothetical protein ACOVOR_05160 [Rhabdochlamydiaceae bacterium]